MKKQFLVFFLAAGIANLQANQSQSKNFDTKIFNNLYQKLKNDYNQKSSYNAKGGNFDNTKIEKDFSAMKFYLSNQIKYSQDFTISELSDLHQKILKVLNFVTQYQNNFKTIISTRDDFALNILDAMKNTVEEELNKKDDLDDWDILDKSKDSELAKILHDQAFDEYETSLRRYIHNHPDDYEKLTKVSNNEHPDFSPEANNILRERAINQRLAEMKYRSTADLKNITETFNGIMNLEATQHQNVGI